MLAKPVSGQEKQMSDATRLRGDGVVITMSDGSAERLIFDFDALCELEELFGSLAEFTTALNSGSKSKIMAAVAKGVSAALRHLPEPPSVSDVRRRLDSRHTNVYITALDQAFYDSMPDPSTGKDSEGTKDSPGTPTTTSEPSDSVVVTASSGE